MYNFIFLFSTPALGCHTVPIKTVNFKVVLVQHFFFLLFGFYELESFKIKIMLDCIKPSFLIKPGLPVSYLSRLEFLMNKHKTSKQNRF